MGTTTAPQAAPRRKQVRDTRIAVVTGGMGFIGSHLVKRLLDQEPDLRVYNIDLNDYAAAGTARFSNRGPYAWGYPPEALDSADRLPDVNRDTRHVWMEENINGCDGTFGRVRRLFEEYQPHVVYHLAAKSHVDRSIDSAASFAYTNVVGTQAMLECARLSRRLEKFVYVSTDEVYGSVPETGKLGHNWTDPSLVGFLESHPAHCGNPYSATKAGGEQLALAYHNTYGLPVVITRGCNTYGAMQFPEKFIPVACYSAIWDRPIPVYGDGLQSRQWMHVLDHADGLIAAAKHGRSGEIYNLSTENPTTNLEIVRLVLKTFSKPDSLVAFVEDRPGHDRHYCINNDKALRELSWVPQYRLPHDLHDVLEWYGSVEGRAWLDTTGHDTRKRLGLCRKESS